VAVAAVVEAAAVAAAVDSPAVLVAARQVRTSGRARTTSR
jgi:hypothetical protein